MRACFNYTTQNCVFLSVARLVQEKNPTLLLDAFYEIWKKHPSAKLVYVGEGYEREKLENFIKEHNLQGAVLLAGEQQNINDWLNMADVFVLPSIEESLPIALLEALQVGKPCIASTVGDIPFWVKTGENGYGRYDQHAGAGYIRDPPGPPGKAPHFAGGGTRSLHRDALRRHAPYAGRPRRF